MADAPDPPAGSGLPSSAAKGQAVNPLPLGERRPFPSLDPAQPGLRIAIDGPDTPHAPTAHQEPRVWRRLFHATAGSSVPVVGIFAPHEAMVVALGVLAVGGLAFDLARIRMPWLNRLLVHWFAPLLKHEEDQQITGATYLAIAAFFAFLLFDQAVAASALLFLSLGDPVAALVGSRMPGPRIFAKSPGGTVAFVAVSLVVVAVLVGSGAVQYHWGLLIGAGLAGLVELTPLPLPLASRGDRRVLNDNLTIPLISGAVMQLLGV
jgi:dolichol kinase